MKKIVFSFVMLLLAIVTGTSQVITVPVANSGQFSDAGNAGTVVNKQFNISTGTNVCINLTILGGSGSGTGSVPPIPYHGKFEFYDCDNSFGSLVKISESTDYNVLSLNVVSRVPNGKMVVVFTFDGSSAYTFQASYRPGANVISNTGPVTLDVLCSATPNLAITDYTSKNMGSIYSTTTDYTKSMILMKSGTYQLGLGANKISGYGNLGISSTGVLSQTATNFVFSTATVPYAFNITSTGNVLIGKTTQTVATNKLDVNGNVNATKFIGDGSGLTGIAGLSQWITNGANIYYNTGSVSIGALAPSNKQGWNKVLDVRGVDDSKIVATTSNETYRTGIFSHSSWVPGGGGFIGTESSHPLYLIAGYDPKMTILTNGNVGINTTTPREALHVKGSIFLEGTTAQNSGWMENYFYWRGHSLIFGTEKGVYAHNTIEIKPGGSSEGSLYSMLNMFTASGIGQNTQRVQIHTDGISYFNGGNVGIGTVNPDATLTVKGKIHAEEVVVDLLVPADYVFEKNYKLMPLSEVEKFVQVNKHLPGIASGKEIVKNGLNMGEMQNKLLEKVEELTLYTIEQDKKLKDQEIINQQLLNEINELKSLINKK